MNPCPVMTIPQCEMCQQSEGRKGNFMLFFQLYAPVKSCTTKFFQTNCYKIGPKSSVDNLKQAWTHGHQAVSSEKKFSYFWSYLLFCGKIQSPGMW